MFPHREISQNKIQFSLAYRQIHDKNNMQSLKSDLQMKAFQIQAPHTHTQKKKISNIYLSEKKSS